VSDTVSAELEELTNRQRHILNLVVDHFIKTGEPVGSRTLMKAYRLPVGAATIRNEMADLEELGFLQHPHTSAGRIPTDKGYRAHVNTIESPILTNDEADTVTRLTEDYIRSNQQVQQILTSSIRLLSDVTKLVSIGAAPSFGKDQLESVQLVDIGHNRILIVLVAVSGRVETFPVQTDMQIPMSTLRRISEIINNRFANHAVDELMSGYMEIVRQIKQDFRAEVVTLFDQLISSINESFGEKLIMEGALQVVHLPEFQSWTEGPESLGDSRCELALISLIRDDSGWDSRVMIGAETKKEALTDLSLVLSHYNTGDDRKGTIGIIGPRRMNYRMAIASVDHIAKMLTEKLSLT